MTPTPTATDILRDSFGRIHDDFPGLLQGLTAEDLLWRPDVDANPIGWLAWHLTRVQDDHVAGVGGVEQVWQAQGFADRFALPYPTASIGYGHSSAEVSAFSVADPELLIAYQDAVHDMTVAVLEGMDAADYQRIVDDRWDPPVTAAVRLVSVVGDATAHLGQIGYVRGMAERRR